MKKFPQARCLTADMAPLAMLASQRLAACRFFPGSWAKTFSRDVHARVMAGMPLTASQHLWLWKLVWQYRGQIKNAELIQEAIRVTGDAEGHKALAVLVEEVGTTGGTTGDTP